MIPMLPAVNYYHKALHLECCSSPRSVSLRVRSLDGSKLKLLGKNLTDFVVIMTR